MRASLRSRLWRALRGDRPVPHAHQLVLAARWAGQRLSAPLYLRGLDVVGRGARTRGRPLIFNAGRMTLGARSILNSMFAPIELLTGPHGSLEIGHDAAINFGARICADHRVVIGDRVAIGPYVVISDEADGDESVRDPCISIGDDAWLATRVRVHRGAVIGAGAVIMAGSEVRGEIPAGTIAGGVPARVLRVREGMTQTSPLSATTVAPRVAEHRGLLISDFNVQELVRHLRLHDPLGPVVDAVVAPFDQVVPTLHRADRWSVEHGVDFALVWARPEAMAGYARLQRGESVPLQELLEEVDAFASLLSSAATKVSCLLVASFAVAPDARGLGMIDLRPGGRAHALLHMNLRLCQALAGSPNVFLLDAQRWIAVGGRAAVQDKLWYLAKIGFSTEVLAEAAKDIRASLRGLRGRARKLIVLDLDETLWGGVVGDVGWEGLRLGGHDAIGEAYVDFQRELQALARRGVLLAIASKNEAALALQAIAAHPEMVLRGEDFCAYRIDRHDKAENVAAIARELELGLQSVVFIDDDANERARVREALPEVHVPEWPADPLTYARTLRAMRCFDTPAISDEDRARNRLYAEERARSSALVEVGSLDAWLEGLGLRARFEPLHDGNVTRAAQLLGKTNQINLSTRRMGEAELRAWARGAGREVWTVSVQDRIGDAGLTGVMGLSLEGPVLRITDFVLSCRVMGRRIEEAMVAAAVRRARALQALAVEAAFVPTSKNEPCREFWERSGFAREGDGRLFRWATEAPYPAPSCVRVEGHPLDGGGGHA